MTCSLICDLMHFQRIFMCLWSETTLRHVFEYIYYVMSVMDRVSLTQPFHCICVLTVRDWASFIWPSLSLLSE